MKLCKGCNTYLNFDCFNKHTETKDGYRSKCKKCRCTDHQKYRYKNKEKFRLYESSRKNVQRSKVSKRNSDAKRRALKKKAIPSWLSDQQKQEILDLYTIAEIFKLYTGQEYHVDHIVPLNNKIVCGLHVPWNLQILTAYENISKNNRFSLGPLT